MARIKTYTVDTNIADNDIIIGSDADNSNETKNFNIGALRTYMLSGLEPEVGGNLKITTIVDNDSEETTPEGYFNNSVTPIIVLHYEIVFLILNGKTFIFRKNNDTYGVDETQVVSGDFTEIDITSVINANLQDLESVLNQGRTASLPPEVPSISLENEILSGYGNVRMGDSNDFIFNDGLKDVAHIKDKELQFKSSTNKFIVRAPSSLTNQTASFQNSSGTIAYLSDIPEVAVESVSAGLNIGITEVSPNNFEISAIIPESVYVVETFLIDSITSTKYYSNGGIFEYNEETIPLNAISITFSDNVSFGGDLDSFASVHIHYENGNNNVIEVNKEAPYIDANAITFPFNFASFYSTEPGSRISFIEIQFYPRQLGSSLSLIAFDGCASSAVCRYSCKI